MSRPKHPRPKCPRPKCPWPKCPSTVWFQTMCQRLLITAPLSTIKYIRHFWRYCWYSCSGVCIVVSVYFWYCFIYWADTSLLSYICIYIWESQRSVTGRILVEYTSQYLINTVWRRHVILDRRRRFLNMFKTLRPAHFHAFCSQDHSRSIKTNVRQVRQSCTLFLHFYPV